MDVNPSLKYPAGQSAGRPVYQSDQSDQSDRSDESDCSDISAFLLPAPNLTLSPQSSLLSPFFSVLSPQHSALSSQSSVLSSQSSLLSPQHSALSTFFSALSTFFSALSTQHSALSPHSGLILRLRNEIGCPWYCNPIQPSRAISLYALSNLLGVPSGFLCASVHWSRSMFSTCSPLRTT